MAKLTLPDGRVINFPDGLQPAQVQSIVKAATGSAPPAQPAAPPPAPVPGATPNLPPQPPVEKGFASGLQIGAQGAGRGLADLAGAPVDLTTLGLNAASGLTNFATPYLEKGVNAGTEFMTGYNPGVDIPDIPSISNPLLGSDNIADIASYLSESAGHDVLDPNTEMDATQRLGYGINRFGSQAMAGAGGMIKAAVGKAAVDVPAMLRPYVQNPGKTFVGDAAGGVGSGAALHAYEEKAPDQLKESALGRLMAMLAGGVVGSGLPSFVKGPKNFVKGGMDRFLPADQALADPLTGAVPKRKAANEAADFLQKKATNKDIASAEIDDAMRFQQEAGGAMPTLGMATDDTGLRYLEKSAALQDAPTFADRYQKVAKSATDDLSRLEVDGADIHLPKQIAEQQIKTKLDVAQSAIDDSGKNFDTATLDEKMLADTYRPFMGGADQASMDLDKAVIDDTMRPRRKIRNERFDGIDPNAKVMREIDPLLDIVRFIEKEAGSLPSSLLPRVLPQALMRDLKKLAPDLQESTVATGLLDESGSPLMRTVQKNEGGAGKMSFKDLNKMRPALTAAEQAAQAAKKYPLADNIRKLKGEISKDADRLAAEGGEAGTRAQNALDYQVGEWAPYFGQGVGGTLRKKIDVDDLARTATPPTKTAGEFLKEGPGGREAAADLQRIMAATPDPKQSADAAKRYVLDSLSRTTIGADGKISETSLQKWMNNRQGMLSQIPELGGEINGLLKEVRGKSLVTSKFRAEVEAARKGMKATEEEINGSALKFYVGNNPQNAVKEILNSGDPIKSVKEIRATFGGDKAADAGFRSAVADHLVKSVSNADGEAVSFAKLSQALKKNEIALKEVFGDDIQWVKQSQRRLQMLSGKNIQGAAGSATAENTGLIAKLRKPYEIVTRMMYGALTGGSMTRKFNLMAEQLPDSSAAANELIKRVVLDPRVAKHLLGMPVKEVGTPRWNKGLNRLMGWAEAGRIAGRDDGE